MTSTQAKMRTDTADPIPRWSRLTSWLYPRIETVSVLFAPRVMMKTESKIRKASRVRNSRATRMAGLMSGRVILVNRCHVVAPSTRAAW
jgi:hypothetical protein